MGVVVGFDIAGVAVGTQYTPPPLAGEGWGEGWKPPSPCRDTPPPIPRPQGEGGRTESPTTGPHP